MLSQSALQILVTTVHLALLLQCALPQSLAKQNSMLYAEYDTKWMAHQFLYLLPVQSWIILV